MVERRNSMRGQIFAIGVAVATSVTLPVMAAEIVVPLDDPAARTAAKDLLAVLGDRPVKVRFALDPAMPTQAWRVKAAGGELAVTGRDGLGVAYGVYSFLERIGCRWYAPDTERKPDLSGWTLPEMEFEGRPAILSRFPYLGGADKVPSTWFFRNKGTARAGVGDTEQSGAPKDCHTFGVYAKGLTNFQGSAEYPWFCLSDPAVRHGVAEQMKANIRRDREERAKSPRYSWPTTYELSQDDGGNGFRCRCAACLRSKEAAGSWSGPNIEFASAVAEEVGREFPDVTVRTFAYSYTELPPTNALRAARNLAIRYCRSFLFQPLTADTDNGRVFRGWDDHVEQKYVWGYWRGYSGPMFPAVKPCDDIGAEMRFCRDMHVHGYFLEGEEPLSRSFALMDVWLFFKLADNPDQDARRLAAEFMDAHYGAAAGAIGKYRDYLERRQKAKCAEIDPAFIRSITSGHLAMYVQRGYLDGEFFATAAPMLDEAERIAAAKGSPAQLAHVRHERLVFDRALVDEWRVASAAGLDVRAAAERIAVCATNVVDAWGFWPKDRAPRMEAARREGERMRAFAASFPPPTPKELEGRDVIEWSVTRIKHGLVDAPDPDSAIGHSAYDPAAKCGMPFKASVHDGWTRKSSWMSLKKEQIPSDGKFHLVKIGKVGLVASARSYIGDGKFNPWIPSFEPRVEERKFWVSAKFTGPAFVKGAEGPNRIFYDRFFIVK